MAEDVLGITGVVNIDDIQKTFDTLISDLERLGVETEQISARMSKALTDIANSSEKDMAAKTKAAMQVLNDAIADTNKQLRSTPEMLKNAEQEASRLQGSVAKLESELGKTVVGSKEFDALNKQLESQREVLRLQITDVADMRAAHEQAAATVSKLQGMYDAFVSSLQGANEAQHEQQQAQQETTQHTEAATQAVQRKTAADKEQAQAQNAVKDAIADTQKTIDELVAKQEAAQKKMEKLRADMEAWAARGIEGGYVTKKGEGQYKADKSAAGYNENVVAQMQRIAKEYNALKQSLQEYRDEETLAREGLAALTQAQQENAQQTQQTTQANEQAKQSSPRQELMQLRNEITMLTLQYREMTDAEKASAEGQALKAKLDELAQKASKLQDAFSDVQEQIKNDASDTGTFQGLTQGLNLVISGFGAAQGAAAAFGMSEEDLARAQTIIQGSLAATNFLTEAQNALQGQSALMRGINTLQTMAAAKATDIETAAKGRNVVVTKAATVAQAAFNLVAKANPYVLLAIAIVTVVGALAAFAAGARKAKKEEEELQRVQEAQKAFYETYNSTLTSTIEKYRDLEHAYKRLKSEKEKTQWIKDNKDKFHELGLELKDIHDTETVFAQNTDQIIKAFDLRARAAAYAAQITKLYNDALAGQEYKVGDKISESKFKELFPQYANFQNHIGDTQYANMVGGIFSDDFYLSEQGVRELNRRAMENVERSAEALRKERDEMNEQAQAILDGLKIKTYDPNSDKGDGNTTNTKDKPKYKSAAELNDELLKLTQERVERELEIEKEGTRRWEQLMRERIALQAEADRRAAQKASDEAIADLDASYKGGKSGLNEQQYNERRAQLQQQTADTIVAINAKEQADIAAIEQTRQKAELTAMLDYLKQYGSIQQQKYAIAKEYDQKIAEEQDEYRRKALEAEKQSRLAQMNAQNIAQSIDWGQMFTGVGNVLQGIAQETLKKVSDYMKTDEYKNLSSTDKKTYVDLRTQLADAGGVTASNPFSGEVWKEIGDAAQRYRDSVVALNAANERAEEIREQLTEAEKAAAQNPTDTKLKATVEQLRSDLEEASTAVNDAQAEYVDAQSDLRDKTESVAKGFNNFNTILGQITSGSLSGFATAVGNIIKKISGSNDEIATNFGELFGEAGKQIGGLVGAILQIIDILGTEPAKFIDYLLTKVADVLEAVLAQLPEIIAAAIKGVGNIIGSVFSGLAEGVASLFGGGADNSAYEEAVDRWGHILTTWEDNLKYERKLMEQAYGGNLLSLQKETIAGLQNAQKAAAEIYRGWAGSGAGWFSHSNGYNVNSDTDWGALVSNNPELAKQLGVRSQKLWGDYTYYTGGNVSDLFNLDWKELEKLKYSNTKFWQSLHGEAQKYLDQYIEAGRQMEEVQKETWEKLTTTTSENVFDDFLNSLYELANKSETVFDDIAKNWQDMVNKMVINNIVGEGFQQSLNGWYERLAKLNERRNKGEIGNEDYQRQLEQLRQEYESYVKQAQQQIEDLRSAGIIASTEAGENYEQEASSKAWQTMSQDTAEELNGRFTALYECGLQLLNLSQQRNELLGFVTADVSALRQQAVQIQGNITELLDVQLESLSHLQNIDVHTASLPDMADFIEKIYNAVKNVNKK